MAKKIDNPIAMAALFLLLAAAIVILGVVPIIASIEKIAAQTSERRFQIDTYGRHIANTRDFIAFEKQENIGLNMVKAGFTDANMPLDLINLLENVAKESDLEIKFSPIAEQKLSNGEWPFIKIEANVGGMVESILKFVDKIENSRYLIEIESIDIKTDPIKEGLNPQEEYQGEIQFEFNAPVMAEARLLIKNYVQLQSE